MDKGLNKEENNERNFEEIVNEDGSITYLEPFDKEDYGIEEEQND